MWLQDWLNQRLSDTINPLGEFRLSTWLLLVAAFLFALVSLLGDKKAATVPDIPSRLSIVCQLNLI